jgi:hypothetical protein
MTPKCTALALAALAAAPGPCPAQDHFGAYAVPARGEWVQSNERLSVEKSRPYVESFRPVDFDARAWARLARAAGMKYAVMTAKHHDGFCLFDSALTDYKITPRFGGRDLVREYLDAFRAEGLRVGLYFVVHTLMEAVSKNGNLLLNVGPDARGRIPEPSVRILEEVGRWMGRNGESILGAGAAELPKPEWGRFTRRGTTLYAHWMYPRVGHIDLGDVGDRVKSARLLPDPTDTVFAVELE